MENARAAHTSQICEQQNAACSASHWGHINPRKKKPTKKLEYMSKEWVLPREISTMVLDKFPTSGRHPSFTRRTNRTQTIVKTSVLKHRQWSFSTIICDHLSTVVADDFSTMVSNSFNIMVPNDTLYQPVFRSSTIPRPYSLSHIWAIAILLEVKYFITKIHNKQNRKARNVALAWLLAILRPHVSSACSPS